MMQLRKYFMKTFLVLSLFSITYSLTSIYVLYSQHEDAMPDLFLDTLDAVAPYHLSCYYAKDTGESYLLSTINETPKPENSIFFHEPSCQWALHLREACSVESVARAHPNRQVYVVFSRPLATDTDCRTGVLETLARSVPNVHYHRVDLNTYAKGTPLAQVFAPRPTWLGKWHYRKIGELLKFLTLYKFGGVVLDLDMFVVRSLEALGADWATRGGEGVESGIISVSRGLSGKYYAQEFLEALKHQIAYDGVTNAGSALKDALKTICNTTDVFEMNREKCKGFRVYSNEFFNSGNWDVKDTNVSEAYLGYHLWNETASGDHMKMVPKDSLYATLARKHCPAVYHGFMSTNPNSHCIYLLVPLSPKSSSDDGIHEELRELLKNSRETYSDFSIFGNKPSICIQKVAFGEMELVQKTTDGHPKTGGGKIWQSTELKSVKTLFLK